MATFTWLDPKTVECLADRDGLWLFADGAFSSIRTASHTHRQSGMADPRFVELASPLTEPPP